MLVLGFSPVGEDYPRVRWKAIRDAEGHPDDYTLFNVLELCFINRVVARYALTTRTPPKKFVWGDKETLLAPKLTTLTRRLHGGEAVPWAAVEGCSGDVEYVSSVATSHSRAPLNRATSLSVVATAYLYRPEGILAVCERVTLPSAQPLSRSDFFDADEYIHWIKFWFYVQTDCGWQEMDPEDERVSRFYDAALAEAVFIQIE